MPAMPAMPAGPAGPAGLAGPSAATAAGARAATADASYRDILRSSLLIGGSAAIATLIGLLRTKAIALLIGPAGFGLLGTFASIADLVRSVAQFGIPASGVRQIADAAASQDAARVARTVSVLRRVAVVCAVLGAGGLIVLSGPISTLSFGSDRHGASVALLSVAVFLGLLASAEGALLQGLRRIGEMARLSIAGALLGSVAAVAIIAVMGLDGVVPSLIAAAAAAAGVTWFATRRLPVAAVRLGAAETWRESAGLLRLGFAFMASGLLMAGAMYAVRVLIVRRAGLEAAGLYAAAWAVGGLYVGFVLQALSTDFYPRLVGVAASDACCNRLVNEQTQMGLLIALPGVLGTLTLAPLAVSLLYSAAFVQAGETVRWICLGMALRVLVWPIGFIVVARNQQLLFFATEAAWTAVYVGLAWVGIAAFGVEGAGIAFLGSYVFQAVVVHALVRRLSGFRWSRVNVATTLAFAGAAGGVFVACRLLSPALAAAVGGVATAASLAYAVRTIGRLVPIQDLPRPIARLRSLWESRP